MRKLPWFSCFLLFCLTVLLIDSVSAEEKPEIKGTFETRVFTAGDARVDTILDIEVNLPLSDSFRLHFRPWLNLDLMGRNERRNGFELHPSVHMRLLEGYLEWNEGPWEIRLGQQHIELGSIDKLSPLDLWRPRDFRDLIEDQPLGLLMASVTYATDRTSVRLLYAPSQPASLFPGPESDWWSGPRVELTSGHPKGGAYGLTVDQRFGDVELGLLVLDHPDPAPVYRPTETGLTEQYVRDRIMGGQLRFPVADWTATIEAAQHWPDQPKVPYRVIVGQVEKIWQVGASETLTLDIGYADRTGGSNLDLNFPFRSAPFVNLNFTSQDMAGLDTTFQFRAIGSGPSGYYLNPEISRQITTDQRVSLGASILTGTSGTFLGDFSGNSRLEAKWQIKF